MQQLTKQEQIDINLILSTTKVLSELVHNVKGVHKQGLKQHYNRLFETVKKYENLIDRMAESNPEGKKDLEFLYDKQIEVLYTIREMLTDK